MCGKGGLRWIGEVWVVDGGICGWVDGVNRGGG